MKRKSPEDKLLDCLYASLDHLLDCRMSSIVTTDTRYMVEAIIRMIEEEYYAD